MSVPIAKAKAKGRRERMMGTVGNPGTRNARQVRVGDLCARPRNDKNLGRRWRWRIGDGDSKLVTQSPLARVVYEVPGTGRVVSCQAPCFIWSLFRFRGLLARRSPRALYYSYFTTDSMPAGAISLLAQNDAKGVFVDMADCRGRKRRYLTTGPPANRREQTVLFEVSPIQRSRRTAARSLATRGALGVNVTPFFRAARRR